MANCAIDNVLWNNMSAYFWYHGFLDFDQHLSLLKPFLCYPGAKNSFSEGTFSASAEVIVVDFVKDAKLVQFCQLVKNEIANFATMEEKFNHIAHLIDDRLAPQASTANIGDKTIAHITDLKKKSNSNMLYIGEMCFGVCRHRATLFKAVCDFLVQKHAMQQFQSRIVRGKKQGAHRWNIVQLEGSMYVVDVMQCPGQLLLEGSPEAELYIRETFMGVEMGTIGGSSIRKQLKTVDYNEIYNNLPNPVYDVQPTRVYFVNYENQSLALKVVLLQDIDESKVLVEAQILRYVYHPCIIALKHTTIINNALYLLSEKYDCNALEAKNRLRTSNVAISQVTLQLLYLLLQVARGIRYLHSRKISHADLKPQNIFVNFDATGKIGTAVIGDMGASKIMLQSFQATMNIFGTMVRC